MLRILIIVFLMLLVYRIAKSRSYKNSRKRFDDLLNEPEPAEEVLTDPVCGKKVPRKDAYLLWQGGKVYGFCSKECMRKFQHENTADWKM